ncbi:hypothetical protein [Geodermatophilus chilensis]|uniref:hypothetical protein n=1 Tax=Geodermatophilus chilensis TaxID=2035835 RepID=UPI0018E47C77|nr:hypothetical protein [Geodermatophilus chilensis]
MIGRVDDGAQTGTLAGGAPVAGWASGPLGVVQAADREIARQTAVKAGYCTSDHRGTHQAPGWTRTLTPDGTLTVTTPTGLTAVTEPPPY